MTLFTPELAGFVPSRVAWLEDDPAGRLHLELDAYDMERFIVWRSPCGAGCHCGATATWVGEM